MEIFKQVASNVLALNQQQVARDEKKLYDQELRTKYDGVVKLMMVNL
jgi:CRISPR/Cas system CMR-associated protein Cmr3 (group 5 of RAMP superfamily)